MRQRLSAGVGPILGIATGALYLELTRGAHYLCAEAASLPAMPSSFRDETRVELRGFEPLTPSMPWRCATSCATAP